MRQNRMQFMRRGLVGLLAVTLVGAGAGVTRASHNFPDVLGGHFFHDAVDFLVSRGITAGIGGGLYGPDQAVTRGQMAVFIERALSNCPPDAVRVGPTCIDKYEASVWQTRDAALVRKIQLGTVTRAELQARATQLGLALGDPAAAGCLGTGSGCTDVYALSVPGVMPARWLTWFQALAAARNAGKRLATNQEWQAAALGTPDGGPCIVSAAGPGLTGTGGCVSDVGAFDLVGNVYEWVAAWVPRSTVPSLGWGTFSDDFVNLAGADPADGPGALVRGGAFSFVATGAGPLAVAGSGRPQDQLPYVGFRAAR